MFPDTCHAEKIACFAPFVHHSQVHLRRFLLSPKAVELFWADSPEVFIAFENVHDRQAFTRNLRKRDPRMLPATTQRGILHPRKVLDRA